MLIAKFKSLLRIRSLLAIFLINLSFLFSYSSAWSKNQFSNKNRAIDKISFGSCNKHDLPQPLWKSIKDNRPQVWVWTGDVIYASSLNLDQAKSYFNLQKNHSEYKSFLNSGIDILGVWDDHDYGINNGGIEHPHKDQMQELFLNFLDESKKSLRRKQKGIYTSYRYGPLEKQIKLILLDTRYFKEKRGIDADLLGEKQWNWLAKELNSSKAKLHFIFSGIQIIPDKHPYEKWSQYPRSRKRLFDLIKSSNASGVIFISGDRHFAEISRLKKEEYNLPYDLIEITSSGLTHSYNELKFEENPYRVGSFFKELNFGLITVDWNKNPIVISLQVKGEGNQSSLEYIIPYTQIKPQEF